MKRRTPIIALAQIKYNHTGRHNVDRIKKYIVLAAKKKADIVCFPETCINKAEQLPLNHKLIKEIQETCKENSIWTIITDNFIANGAHYKMAILVDREGKIRGKYKKIHLYGDETKENGKRIFVKDTDFGKIGIVICWDLAFPKLFRKMKNAGAEMVFCPAYWGYESKAHKENPKENEKNIIKSMMLSRISILLGCAILTKKNGTSYHILQLHVLIGYLMNYMKKKDLLCRRLILMR